MDRFVFKIVHHLSQLSLVVSNVVQLDRLLSWLQLLVCLRELFKQSAQPTI